MQLFLALIIATAQVLTPFIGVQIEVSNASTSMPYLAPGSWIKYRVDWSVTEAQPGVYDWTALDATLQPLQGWRLLLTVHNAPVWRRLVPDYPCRPIPPSQYQAYADFVNAVIDRYHPQAVELWNEPDGLASPDTAHLFGCWSTPDLPHYGGQRYGEMVSYVCPRVKAEHPAVTVLAAGLMLSNPLQEDFAAGIPARACDGLGFHFYPSADQDEAVWGLLQGKIGRLNQMGHTNLWLTETSLLDAATPEQQERQAAYFDYLLTHVTGLRAIFWFTLTGNGWRESDMVVKGSRRPVWYRYSQFLR